MFSVKITWVSVIFPYINVDSYCRWRVNIYYPFEVGKLRALSFSHMLRNVTLMIDNHSVQSWRGMTSDLLYFKKSYATTVTYTIFDYSDNTLQRTMARILSDIWRSTATKMALTCRRMKRPHLDDCLSRTNTRNLVVFDEEYQNTWGLLLIQPP